MNFQIYCKILVQYVGELLTSNFQSFGQGPTDKGTRDGYQPPRHFLRSANLLGSRHSANCVKVNLGEANEDAKGGLSPPAPLATRL